MIDRGLPRSMLERIRVVLSDDCDNCTVAATMPSAQPQSPGRTSHLWKPAWSTRWRRAGELPPACTGGVRQGYRSIPETFSYFRKANYTDTYITGSSMGGSDIVGKSMTRYQQAWSVPRNKLGSTSVVSF